MGLIRSTPIPKPHRAAYLRRIMAENENLPRRYSEKEVAILLRRATEIQQTDPSSPDSGGLTLAELEDIAAEAGIDVGYLRSAAAELESLGPPSKESMLQEVLAGAPFTIRLEKRIPGQVPESRLEELVPIIEMATDGHGQASAIGSTLTWSSTTSGNTSSQQVLVQSGRGETLVRIEDRVGGLAGALYGGIVGGGSGVGIGAGGAVAGVIGLPAFLIVAIPAGIIGSSYMVARAIFTAQVRRRRARMEELMDQIAMRVERSVHERTLPAAEIDAE
jgi:hypothetical protein